MKEIWDVVVSSSQLIGALAWLGFWGGAAWLLVKVVF